MQNIRAEVLLPTKELRDDIPFFTKVLGIFFPRLPNLVPLPPQRIIADLIFIIFFIYKIILIKKLFLRGQLVREYILNIKNS